MKKLLGLLTALLPICAMAQVTVSGSHYDVPSPVNVDHVVLFADLSQNNAYLAYVGGDAAFEWRDFAGNVLQSGAGAETLYPEDKKGYILYSSTDTVSYYVLDYKLYHPTLTSLVAEPDCDHTTLTLEAEIPTLEYQDIYQMKHQLTRNAEVRYTSLSWTGVEEGWADSLAVETVRLQQKMVVGAPLRDTYFSVSIDQYASFLGLEPDSIVSAQMEAIAVACHPTSITTARGETKENEVERPTDETVLSGSAPIEINFLSNANKPTATFFRWEIYKGTQLIASRTDEDQRYTFMDYGQYQVKVWVSNSYCVTDSVVFDVSISSSQLVVPNVFTPNGDGVNDEFRVQYRSLSEFDCWIYNRWGKLVYHWSDPAKGWDGTIHGRPAAAGAYFYVIRARGTDAEAGVKYHKITKRKPIDVGVYQLSGDINLVR